MLNGYNSINPWRTVIFVNMIFNYCSGLMSIKKISTKKYTDVCFLEIFIKRWTFIGPDQDLCSFHWRFFHHNLNLMEVIFCSHPDSEIFTNFAHDMTTVLSWHVQKFVVIWLLVIEIENGKFSIELELRVKNC